MSRNTNNKLSLEQAIDAISKISIPFPKNAIEVILAHEKKVTPLLINEVKKAIENHSDVANGTIKQEYAIHILAHFKNKDLLPLVYQLLQLPIKEINNAFSDDFIPGCTVPNIIASVFNGDLQPIFNVFENTELDDYIRSSVIRSLMPLVLTKQISEKDVSYYLIGLMEEDKLADESPFIWATMTGLVMDLYLNDVVPYISDAFDLDYIDEDYTDHDHFLYHFESKADGYNETMDYNNQCYHFIDVAKDMGWWACFKTEEEKTKEMENINKMIKDFDDFSDLPIN